MEEVENSVNRSFVAKSQTRWGGKWEMGLEWLAVGYKRRDHTSSETPGVMYTIMVDVSVSQE